MFRRGLCLFAVWLGVLSTGWGQSNAPSPRTWTDATGKYRVAASFVRIEDNVVVLKKGDGNFIRVPIASLSQEDQRIARASASVKPPQESGEGRAPGSAVQISASISKEAPFGVIVFGEIERQNPVFVTLQIRGQAVADAVKYGQFRFDSIKDDRGKTLKLLKPLEGQFNAKLQEEMVDLDHFFLDRPNELKLHLILQQPSKDAKQISITGSFQLDVGQSITIDNVMSNLDKPLTAPGLDKIGRVSVSLARRGESDVAGALAIDFSGDRTKIDDVELLSGDGEKISTGGTGSGSRQQARYIRWTGEKLPKDTKLRIVLKGKPKQTAIPIKLASVALNGKPASPPAKSKSPANRTAPTKPPDGRSTTATIPETNRPTAPAVPAPREIAILFFRACQQGDLPVVRELLEKHPSLIWRTDPRWKETAFSKACWNGRLEVVKFLIDRGADVNARAGDKVTPLHQAARQGQLDVVRLLLSKGADPKLKSDKGQTAENLAAAGGHPDVVREIESFESDR